MSIPATPLSSERSVLVTPGTAAWMLAALCSLGLALRLFGIGFGLPGLYHPDEIPILNVSLGFAKIDLNPHRFLYPTLFYYALFAWEGLFFAAGRVSGLYPSLAAFQREFFADPSHLVLAGRTLTAVFGTATIVAVYRFGTRLYDRATGIGAALFLAVAPFAVRDAHYIKHDVPVTFFIVATLAALAAIVADPGVAARRRSWLVAGALSGLAMSTHWYAIVVVVPVMVVATADIPRTGRWRTSFGLLVWAGLASVVAFFAASPFMLVEPRTVMDNLAALKRIDIDRAVAGAGRFSSVWAYVAMFANDAMGWPVIALGLAGFAAAIRNDWRRGLLLASFPLAFFAFLVTTVPVSRYTNAMLPSIAVAAAWVVTRVAARAPRALAVASASMLLVATPAAWGSLKTDLFLRQADTRSLALAFIEREIPDGATILVQPYSVQPRVSRESLLEALTAHFGSASLTSVKFRNQLAVTPRPPAYRIIYLGDRTDAGADPDKIFISTRAFDNGAGLRALRDRGVEYVVLKEPGRADPLLARLEAALERDGRIIATFSPYRDGVSPERRAAIRPFEHNWTACIDPALERPGPTIHIWRISP